MAEVAATLLGSSQGDMGSPPSITTAMVPYLTPLLEEVAPPLPTRRHAEQVGRLRIRMENAALVVFTPLVDASGMRQQVSSVTVAWFTGL